MTVATPAAQSTLTVNGDKSRITHVLTRHPEASCPARAGAEPRVGWHTGPGCFTNRAQKVLPHSETVQGPAGSRSNDALTR